MNAGFEQLVRERAYELWVAAGMVHGAADAHWLSAEASVRNEANAPVAKVLKTAKAQKTGKAVKTAVKAPKSVAKAAPARKSVKAESVASPAN